jgi:hypothetical protein
MPSGVIQFSASTLPPGADLAAALVQASSVADLNSEVLSVMAVSSAQVLQAHHYQTPRRSAEGNGVVSKTDLSLHYL